MQGRRFIISGGGTGGHIFPAIAIADEIRRQRPEAELLFVGARGKMEMTKVPQAGYQIKGLWISGLTRSLTWKNLLFPIKVVASLAKAYQLIRQNKPYAVIGVGGYASGPMVYAAARTGIPTIIQEQNSYAGLTNKWLAKRVDCICVAYQQMEKFFPTDKIVLTGNPVRLDLLKAKDEDQDEARKHFGLEPDKHTILVVGGSLGARTFNQVLRNGSQLIGEQGDVQILWQMGSLYESEFTRCETAKLQNVQAVTFIDRMDLAYRAADLVICRAGALTISELCLLKKASILVPSPNVAEDHQTMNALSLVQRDAAIHLPDQYANARLLTEAFGLVRDRHQLDVLREKIGALAKPDATRDIVNEIFKIADKP